MEIERKIILTSLPDEVPVHHSTVEQIYISLNPEVRLRKNLNSDVPFRLTVKGDGTLCREEIESSVTEEFYNEMVRFIGKSPVIKDYYIYQINGHKVEVSVVDDGAFIYSEVEFDSVEEAKAFIWPFEGYDATEDPQYKMKNYWKRTRENI